MITQGQSGNDAAAVQSLIDRCGISCSVDGQFGPKSMEALQKVQRNMGINPDGKAGKITLRKMVQKAGVNYLQIDPNRFQYTPLWGKALDKVYGNGMKKDKIFLHHTASKGDPYFVRNLFQRKSAAVGTDFVLGGYDSPDDGVLLQLYGADKYRYHINMLANFRPYKTTKKNREHEELMAKRCLAIEVCNLGYLKWDKKRGKFYCPDAEYITVPDDQVVDYKEIYGEDFRGWRFFQRYTPKQIDTLQHWIEQCEKYMGVKIEKGIYNLGWFDYCHAAVYGRRTLMTHTQVRNKTDMHPQPELIDMLNKF